MDKQRIITDSSVLYNIADGTTNQSDFANKHLVTSYLNLREILSGYNIINGRSHYVGLCDEAIKKYYSEIVPYEEYDYLLMNIIYDYKVDGSKFNLLLKTFEQSAYTRFAVTDFNKAFGKMVIEATRKPLQDSLNRINYDFKIAKENNAQILGSHKKALESRKQFLSEDISQSSRAEIMMLLLRNQYVTNPKDVIIGVENTSRWEKFDFFLNVYSEYMKDFVAGKRTTLKYNDWADLWMTVYVGRNDLFWTAEKYWIELIKSNSLTAKYLYLP